MTAPAVQTGAVWKEKQQVPSSTHSNIDAAVEAFRRGWQAVPIRDGTKRPYGTSWTHLRLDSEESTRTSFETWSREGATNIGLLLGEQGNRLIDVDLDHPRAMLLRDHFLPPSPMQTGRPSRPRSHRWYVATGEIPSTRRYTLPNGTVTVELRSSGGQTLIPPSTWHPKPGSPKAPEPYRWEGQPWGGKKGPAEVDGRTLSVQVALLALGAVLLDVWPDQGSRHEAYLALAGGLLRMGEGIHPYWERNLPVLISGLADATGDEDGPDARVSEVMDSTLRRLRESGKAYGFPRLAEIIGSDHAEKARRLARDVEELAGVSMSASAPELVDGPLASTLPPEVRNPLEERISTWERLDLEPYLLGDVVMPEPAVLKRSDGKHLFYPGRVNGLYGMSESGKSWVAILACLQEIDKGERVLFIDLEDQPEGVLNRLRSMGGGDDDIKYQLGYVLPDGPLADMQRYRFGVNTTEDGRANADAFRALLKTFDPTLIVVDGMTALYGMHGHDTNDASGTDIITSWLKGLTRAGRTTVVIIDHTGKAGGAGASPIGAHHKVAMIQGCLLRVDVIERPVIGRVGRLSLVVFKDRPSMVRAVSTSDGEPVAGIVTLDSTQPGRVRMSLDPGEEGVVTIGATPGQEAKIESIARSQEIQTQILEMFGGDVDKELTTAEVIAETGAPREDVYNAWGSMKLRGEVVQKGTTRWTRYSLAYKEEKKK